MKKLTVSSFLKMKSEGQKITALTAYDASFAQLFDQQNVEILLIGDSLGMVLKGEDSTLGVSIDDIAYHTKCVCAGVDRAFVIADMPFMTYGSKQQALDNAAKLVRAGASMVKVEGGEWLLDTISALVERSVPVCGHLGLTPQSVNVLGGFKVQGREDKQAKALIESALALQNAGAQMLVLECVPIALAKQVSERLTIPVIGIGAGADTDGQILVMHDLLGISANYMPKFSKNFLAETGDIRSAVDKYIEDVKSASFPDSKHWFE